MTEVIDSPYGEITANGLPDSALTRDGVVYCPRDAVWRIDGSSDRVVFDFRPLRLSPGLMTALKYVMTLELARVSAETASCEFAEFCSYFRFARKSGEMGLITFDDVVAYRSSLSKRSIPRLSRLSLLLRKWNAYGVPGVEAELIRFLEEITIPGANKGVAVATMDPVSGPFSQVEFHAITDGVRKGYRQGLLSLREYVLCMIFLCFGLRSVQCNGIKLKDISVVRVGASEVKYLLRIPRAKQKGRGQRECFKIRTMTPQLGEAVMELSKEVRGEFGGLGVAQEDLPLFPMLSRLGRKPEGFSLHPYSDDIAEMLVRAIRKLGVHSERTGGLLNVSAYRIRRTFGTRLAQEGHGELVIAELLDHSDTQNVGVYVSAVPEIAERIDRAIAFRLAPLARAFAGEVVDPSGSGGGAGCGVSAPEMTGEFSPVGRCGQRAECELLAPLACYTCRSFRPFSDAPHEKILDWLIGDRDRLIAFGDLRIASINDRTILAVAEVVSLCKAKQKGLPSV